MHHLLLSRFVLALGILLSTNVHAKEQVSPCIQYETADQNRVHIARVDLHCPSIKIIGTPIKQSNQTTSNFAFPNKTTVAINGAFFDENNKPQGLNVSNGIRWPNSYDTTHHAFLACTTNNHCFIEAPNRKTAHNPAWHTVISGWQTLKNGSYICPRGSQRICHSNARGQHPRTAVGLSDNNRYLYLVVVEGRKTDFQGYTLNQLARLFKKMGVNNALNLDGGGSSTMVVNRTRVNELPSRQFFLERNVANHLGIIDTTTR
ncbi:phosphodiester glycosidase family protein [Advenella sp. RU8]|uniref:phosphodiester glycosidase family protein n=1 Tax=Advenella sp. RU8 TaxID=3399575 RepID=UPI003AAA462C